MDALKPLIPGMDDFFDNSSIGSIINFIKLLIDNSVDLIYGFFTLIWKSGEEIIELIPTLWDIILDLLDLLDYLIDLLLEHWRMPVVVALMIPSYLMTFAMIGRINSILD